MSELVITRLHANFRLQLLATVSTLSLLTAAASSAKAEDTARPVVWIELGGQLERMTDGQDVFDPPFLPQFDRFNFNPVLPLQRPQRYSFGGEGKISFEPVGLDWVFSASVRYGRSNGHKSNYQRLPEVTWYVRQFGQVVPVNWGQPVAYHINASTANAERHVIADFEAGKDVGLGAFGKHGSSLLSAGVRFAQFSTRSTTTLGGVPDFWHSGDAFKYGGIRYSQHRYAGSVDAERSFSGIGPSVSWNASTPIGGNGDDSEILLDWGVNAAALFGRQKVKGEKNITGLHYTASQYLNILNGKNINIPNHVASSYHRPVALTRSRSVVIPNIGAFAGASFRYASAKISFGYRADFFFGAMDGGIDTRKTYDRNFYGPFAAISIGLGG